MGPVTGHYTLNNLSRRRYGQLSRSLVLDHGGFVTFELGSVRNDSKISTSRWTFTQTGAGISLYNPDTGVTYTYAGDFFATHYLIADSRNHQILEVRCVAQWPGWLVHADASDNTPYPSVLMMQGGRSFS